MVAYIPDTKDVVVLRFSNKTKIKRDKMSKNYIGRQKIACTREGCGKVFSTHSSNRTICHNCVPKCRERHFFIKNTVKSQKSIE